MNEMVMRVTRAISDADYDCAGDYRKLARAAIEAMREPTDEQRNAYYELSGKTEVMFDAHWERAIDAALQSASK